MVKLFLTAAGGLSYQLQITWIFCQSTDFCSFCFLQTPASSCCEMDTFYQCKEILKIQKFRRIASYAGFYCFSALITYAYTSNTYAAAEAPLFYKFIESPHILFFPDSIASEIIVGQGLGFQELTSIMLPTLLVLSY